MLLELFTALTLSQQVRATPSIEKLVNVHVDKILSRGYAEKISSDDFFHGHLILYKPRGSCYEDMDALESSVEMILYHTAEHNGRWQNESSKGIEHIPRSIVGFKDGSIVKSIDVVSYDKLYFKAIYDLFGTVYSDDLMLGKDYLQDGSKKSDVTCVRLGEIDEELSFQFLITPEGEVYFPKR